MHLMESLVKKLYKTRREYETLLKRMVSMKVFMAERSNFKHLYRQVKDLERQIVELTRG